MGFTHTFANPGIYIHSHNQDVIILVFYVDSALFMGSNRSYLKLKKQEFMKKWESCDLGDQMVTRMTGLVVMGMVRWKRNLRIVPSPPGLKSLKNSFFLRRDGGRGS